MQSRRGWIACSVADMHPAFSVIFFTTLSGAGYGLLFWSALAALTAQVPARPLLVSVLLALMLVTTGLLSSLAHLGKPQRAWRALSQWRTSWLSREGVASLLTYAPALLFAALLLPGMISEHVEGEVLQPGALGVAVCIALAVCAIATVICTAMIYVSLKPIPAWRHRLVLPGYMLFALISGGWLLAAIATLSGTRVGDAPLLFVAALAVALALLKLRYWRDIDATPLPATRGAAVGLPQRTVTVFERPNTQANYITREMAFVVARKHSRRLRRLAMVLFMLVPILCLLLTWWLGASLAWLGLAAVSTLAGAFVERWLFFAEAKHLVTLYY